ncbi:MAG: FAD-dependent oxidoreductase, partial [Chloroflexota bacterium]|nr:FAD-dependent oxidoreductase [Chloroflexota bacterium]
MNVAVIGGGIFGMASALELTLRGHKVTLFEKDSIPAQNASSTDVSKGIRRTWYGDDDKYVELVEQAAYKWREWESSLKTRVYHQTGSYLILESLEPGSPMHNSLKVLKSRGAKLEILSAKEGKAKFPQINTLPDEICVYDPWGGYIESSNAIIHLLSLALEMQIDILEGHEVSAIEDLGDSAS